MAPKRPLDGEELRPPDLMKWSQTNQIWSLIPRRFVGKAGKNNTVGFSILGAKILRLSMGFSSFLSFFSPSHGRISENFRENFSVRNILHDFILLAFSHFENDKVEKFLPRGLAPLSHSRTRSFTLFSLFTRPFKKLVRWPGQTRGWVHGAKQRGKKSEKEESGIVLS